MQDMLSEFDADFEPQSRPRSGTWPLRRPNIEKPKKTPGAVTLGTTIEENSAQIIEDYNGENSYSNSKQEFDLFSSVLDNNSASVFPSTLDNVLVGTPPNANLVTQLSTLSERPSNELGDRTNGNISQGQTTVTELHTQKPSYDSNRSMWCDMNHQGRPQQSNNTLQTDNTNALSHSANIEVNFTPSTTPSVSSPPTATSTTTPKAKSSRKNAWGNMSYADLITQAIEDSPEKRLTLAQIYEWMVKHIPYFKDKGDSNSSAGWKNSIRHNLSLHSKFKRIQNEGTGKSSWWVINHEAKPGKSPRRRAASMDTTSAKYKAAQRSKAKQKAELKKQKLGKVGLMNADSPPWGRTYDTPVSKAMSSEFRTRTSSNASSVGGRLSPAMFLRDITDDDGPISPRSGSNGNISALSSSLPSGYSEMFEIPSKSDAAGVDHIQTKLSKTSIVPYSQSLNESDSVNAMPMYVGNQASEAQKQIQNTPNLASLLQQTPNQSIKTEPQSNQSFPSSFDMNSGMQQQQTNANAYNMYSNNTQQRQGGNFGSYNSYNMSPNANGGIYQQQMPQQYGGSMQSNISPYNPSLTQLSQVTEDHPQFNVKTEGNFPDDIDVDRPFFDSSDVDLNQILADPANIDVDFASFCDNNNSSIRGPNNNYEMGMDIGSGGMLIGGQPNNPLQSNLAVLQDRGMMNSYQQSPKSQYSMQ